MTIGEEGSGHAAQVGKDEGQSDEASDPSRKFATPLRPVHPVQSSKKKRIVLNEIVQCCGGGFAVGDGGQIHDCLESFREFADVWL